MMALMGRKAAAAKASVENPRRERGAMTAVVLRAIGLLVASPRRPLDLMGELDLSRRSVERLLRGIKAAGLDLEVERSGNEAYYRLSRESVRKKLA
jgi:hypothetical protein